jgi:hypothetical protein
MIVKYQGREYRIYGSQVEVRIPAGQPRVMQLSVRAAHWRTLKPNSKIAAKVLQTANKQEPRP